ncbi:MAG: hypothetical protein E7381_04810 [Clostridiales bacterium]|nr:hypothetical protein [Clostridiales bacterium]
MATIELERATLLTVEEEAQKHNAMINERYRRLQDAEADQFGSSTIDAQSVSATVIAPEKPVQTQPVDTSSLAQAPQVTEYVRSRIETPVFTTEKFNAVSDVAVAKPTVSAPVAPMPVEVIAPVQAVEQEVQYSLSRMAKMVIVAFVTLVVAMLSLICVNTQIIRQKTIRIQNLEEKKQELIEQNQEIQRRIEIAQSDETIREFAQSQGMILGE